MVGHTHRERADFITVEVTANPCGHVTHQQADAIAVKVYSWLVSFAIKVMIVLRSCAWTISEQASTSR